MWIVESDLDLYNLINPPLSRGFKFNYSSYVYIIYFILARVSARPSVLWCYKSELGFSSHRKKRIKHIKKQIARGIKDPDEDDPFELFISSTNIRYTYYKESQKILGSTWGMCVLQVSQQDPRLGYFSP